MFQLFWTVSEMVGLTELSIQVNEHYLSHGTKEEYVLAIARDGLDNRFSKEKPMLGRGIYGAESPTKSDQYTGMLQCCKNDSGLADFLIMVGA